MAERTATDSEKVEEIALDKTQEINAILSAETPVVTEDGGEINRRVKRNIIIVPEPNVFEKDGTTYRRDRNGRWRPVLH
ncbi:hypothetical protein X777_16786 [Ooceraea biroi]|uniref:Uncharacterized protein n=1 Tax=Ooceraea biroi TaxID=2015173 RepID=A0A026WVF3_OOCBI|nr:hypothetical protein X777_16786 [Ooceraea biroi]